MLFTLILTLFCYCLIRILSIISQLGVICTTRGNTVEIEINEKEVYKLERMAGRQPDRIKFGVKQQKMYIGIISDTHGLLREEVKVRLQKVDLILHAGDVCSETLLESLQQLAPVYAVRGNCDRGEAASRLPARELIQIGGYQIYMLHDLSQLDIDPVAADVQVVIYGHTHVASSQQRGQVLFINPGSAGPRRFLLPVTMGFLTLDDETCAFEIIVLEN